MDVREDVLKKILISNVVTKRFAINHSPAKDKFTKIKNKLKNEKKDNEKIEKEVNKESIEK